jgi:hypothetical protein
MKFQLAAWFCRVFTVVADAKPPAPCPDEATIVKFASRILGKSPVSAWCVPVRYVDGDRLLVVGTTHRAASFIGVLAHDGRAITKRTERTSGFGLESFQRAADLDGDGIDEVAFVWRHGDKHNATVIGLSPKLVYATVPLPDPTCERLEIARDTIVLGCEQRVRYRWRAGRLEKT